VVTLRKEKRREARCSGYLEKGEEEGGEVVTLMKEKRREARWLPKLHGASIRLLSLMAALVPWYNLPLQLTAHSPVLQLLHNPRII